MMTHIRHPVLLTYALFAMAGVRRLLSPQAIILASPRDDVARYTKLLSHPVSDVSAVGRILQVNLVTAALGFQDGFLHSVRKSNLWRKHQTAETVRLKLVPAVVPLEKRRLELKPLRRSLEACDLVELLVQHQM